MGSTKIYQGNTSQGLKCLVILSIVSKIPPSACIPAGHRHIPAELRRLFESRKQAMNHFFFYFWITSMDMSKPGRTCVHDTAYWAKAAGSLHLARNTSPSLLDGGLLKKA